MIGSGDLKRLREDTGDVQDQFSLDQKIAAPGFHVPSSAMTISRSERGTPVMTVGAVDFTRQGPSYVVALDLAVPSDPDVLWKYDLAERITQNWAATQFPIIHTSDGRARVIFPGIQGSTFIIGD